MLRIIKIGAKNKIAGIIMLFYKYKCPLAKLEGVHSAQSPSVETPWELRHSGGDAWELLRAQRGC